MKKAILATLLILLTLVFGFFALAAPFNCIHRAEYKTIENPAPEIEAPADDIPAEAATAAEEGVDEIIYCECEAAVDEDEDGICDTCEHQIRATEPEVNEDEDTPEVEEGNDEDVDVPAEEHEHQYGEDGYCTICGYRDTLRSLTYVVLAIIPALGNFYLAHQVYANVLFTGLFAIFALLTGLVLGHKFKKREKKAKKEKAPKAPRVKKERRNKKAEKVEQQAEPQAQAPRAPRIKF